MITPTLGRRGSLTGGGNSWSQQGNKLVGNGSDGKAAQGASVALSADGNTAIVGGAHDDSKVGAVWVFTRNVDVWSQQGKLVGTEAIGKAGQGSSVALSADGNTAIVGGPGDNSAAGQRGSSPAVTVSGSNSATNSLAPARLESLAKASPLALRLMAIPPSWADLATTPTSAQHGFSRSGAGWSQQGGKLVASDVAGSAKHGYSVSLCQPMAKPPWWVGLTTTHMPELYGLMARMDRLWSQQHKKLVGPGATGRAEQGFSVAISADGSTAIAGGIVDNKLTGAAWGPLPQCLGSNFRTGFVGPDSKLRSP